MPGDARVVSLRMRAQHSLTEDVLTYSWIVFIRIELK